MLHGNLKITDADACIDMGVGATAFAAAIDTGMASGTASPKGTAVTHGNLKDPDADACIDMGVGATAFAAAVDTGMATGTASSKGTAVGIGLGLATACTGTPIATGMGCDAI